MTNTNKKSVRKNATKARSTTNASGFGLSSIGKNGQIAGVKTSTIATVLGAAAVGGAGYLLWKNRERIMGALSDVSDSVVDLFEEKFGHEASESTEAPEGDTSWSQAGSYNNSAGFNSSVEDASIR